MTLLQDAAQNANEAADEAAAALAWSDSFAFLMPLPETDEVEVLDHNSGRALMQIPDIEIQVFDVEGGKLLATYMNEVPDVERDRYMTFTIVNRHIVPDFAMVEWTVRNDGGDAVALGDLGHKRGGIGLLSVDEHTAYIGKHYMDCVIRCNGSVFSARRVPVFIKAGARPLLAQAKRSWTRLRTRRGRRS